MTFLQTTRHPSGRFTCMARESETSVWRDLPGVFLANLDKEEFFREVDALRDELQRQGKLAGFDDIASRQ